MEKDKIKKLSPIHRVAYKVLKDATNDLLNGECDEQDIADTLTAINPQAKGYKREDDYVTIDKGMKLLGMGQNRVAFCDLMRKNGILNEKFNTIKIGYNRQKILSLKYDKEEEYQARIAKLDKKKKLKNDK